MNYVYKVIAYTAISVLASYLISLGNGVFFAEFSNNIIGLLATILALNITASTLIYAELNKLKTNYPNSDLKESTTSLKRSFVIQVISLLSLFVILILRDFFIAKSWQVAYVNLISDASIIGVFMYYIGVIYDLGCALYNILSFNSKGK